jgi:hypothetical protein
MQELALVPPVEVGVVPEQPSSTSKSDAAAPVGTATPRPWDDRDDLGIPPFLDRRNRKL